METKIMLLFFILFGQISWGQIGARIILQGQVRNDLVPVENVIVFNANSNTGTLANQYGSFKIQAKANDTLVISSLMFKSKKIVLKAKDFIESKFVVELDVFTNELAEVLVLAKRELSPIEGNTQKYVDLKYFDDEKSSPKNRLLPPNGSFENGVDFVRIYKDVIGVLRKNNPQKTDFYKDTSFSEVVMNKVNYSFFSNTLHLKDDEIKLFLIYCENDSKSRVLMQPNQEFKLMDFLITKNEEYKKITQYR
ncbi:peptidase associated/transthyretin-like domain-containing protein [Flavobacterium flavipallidum]|uniref:Carboxypeptidase-like protein n=1 Tax=Flavobacterium flavipallidum TaxID=3139140 RepID=A0ABU9HRG1_9FLAO